MVSLNIRKLREVNLCGFFDFGLTGPNSGNEAPVLPKRVKFQFCSYQSFIGNKTFSKRSHLGLEGQEK